MHASFLDLIKLVLPESLFEYFQMVKHEIKDSSLHIYLEELNHVPPEYLNEPLMSKGFLFHFQFTYFLYLTNLIIFDF